MRSLLTDFTDSLWASLRVVNSDNTTSAPQVDRMVLARSTIAFAISSGALGFKSFGPIFVPLWYESVRFVEFSTFQRLVSVGKLN